MKQPWTAVAAAILCLLTGCAASGNPEQPSSLAAPESYSQPASEAESQASQTQAASSSTPSQPQGNVAPSSAEPQASPEQLDREGALAIALNNAGVDKQDAYHIKVEQDRDNGIPIFDIEFETNYGDYDYEVAIQTGEIVGADYEVDEEFLDNLGGTPVTAEEAKAIVQKKVPGAPLESIRIWEEGDDGRRRYEGELFYQNMKYEFEIDPQTGILFDWNADLRG